MPKFTITLHVEPGAPTKPGWGAPCNGCGVCCLVEPCPLGMVLSGRRRGRCSALRWDALGQRYRCGALTDAAGVVQIERLPLPGSIQTVLVKWLSRLAYRWVSAGSGCDCDVVVVQPTLTSNLEAH
jgi:hypothetical protein